MKASIRNKLIYLFSIFSFLMVWEITARTIDSELILPSLSDVIKASVYFIQTKDFWIALLFSFGRVLFAFTITFALGTFLGFLSSFFHPLRTFLSFPFSVIKSVPVVALIMLMLFWFNSQSIPVISAVLMTLPVMTEAVTLAVDKTDSKLLQMAKVFKLSFFKKIRFIYIPETKSAIKGTGNTVFSLTWKVVAAGEILSMPKHALGFLIQENRILFEPAKVFSITVFLCIISILSSKFFAFLFPACFSVIANIRKKHVPAFPEQMDFLLCSNKDAVPLKVEDLSAGYNGKILFENLNFEIKKEMTTCLFAPSGSGKTTLLNIIAGLTPGKVFSGEIKNCEVSYIFQEPRLVPGLSVLQNVMLSNCLSFSQGLQRAMYFLNQCGLGEKIFLSPETLSGGEKQKVQICRAFMTASPLILMDEGTSSLDENTKKEMWCFILNLLKKEKRTLLFVTHDKSEAEKYADKIINIS